MRKFALLMLLTSIAAPALAKKVTVQRFEQMLAADHAKPDADLEKELSDLELTERVNAATLARWQAGIAGPKARLALVALADRAAFLSPPATEIPDQTTPDFATQRRIMSLTADYVTRTIPKLPNFYASRETIRFEDRPAQSDQALQLAIGFEPLHAVSSAKSTVLYREGKEVVDTGAAKDGKTDSQEQGLNAWGLFGPILGTVLVDAGHGTLAWSHWEQGAAGKLAVFRYTVPNEKSNYEVSFCCIPHGVENRAIRALSGYHGEMVIDPATGAILRMTLIADLPLDALVQRADIEVEYGTEQIGGAEYLCPVRSISIYKARMIVPRRNYRALGPFQTMLNDVLFSQYHLFRAETRILTAGDARPMETSPADGVGGDKSAAADSPANGSSSSAAGHGSLSETAAVDSGLVDSLANQGELAATAPVVTASVAGVDAAEISVTDAAGLPDSPASDTAPERETDLTPRSSARQVDVSVVANDKLGRAVTNLKREVFEIDDDNDRQTIGSFTPAGAAPSPDAAAVAAPAKSTSPTVFSNRDAIGANVGAAGQAHTTILFLDGARLDSAEVTYVREGVARFLPGVPADESVGLYAIKANGFQVVAEATTDRAALLAKLGQWIQSGQDATGAEHPSSNALPALISAARHLAAIPGHKSLVWIGNAIPAADESGKAANAGKHSMNIDDTTFRAQNELSDANVSFYPLGAPNAASGAKPDSYTGNRSRQIEPPDLAQSTGGRPIRRDIDLAVELKSVVEEGRATYMLSFTPDVPPDGQYHFLRVKLNPPGDVTLRYRAGYYYDREAPALNQRFQDAIWQQKDAKEIALTGSPAGGTNGKTLKLTIAAADIDFAGPDGLWGDKLDVYLADRCDGLHLAQITGTTLDLRLKSATYQKMLREGIQFEQLVETAPDTTSVRILVVDENSGRIGSITMPASALLQQH